MHCSKQPLPKDQSKITYEKLPVQVLTELYAMVYHCGSTHRLFLYIALNFVLKLNKIFGGFPCVIFSTCPFCSSRMASQHSAVQEEQTLQCVVILCRRFSRIPEVPCKSTFTARRELINKLKLTYDNIEVIRLTSFLMCARSSAILSGKDLL